MRIRCLGVIDDAVLALHPGFTVLTGETGAGKTMVVQGLGLLLGARADSALVRSGAPRAAVEGLLTLPPEHPAISRVVDAGGEIDDGDLVLARTVGADGRSRAFVGGRSAPIGVLADLGEQLVAVHGQADQWRLRRPDQHRELLDVFGGPAIAERLTAYQQVYAALGAARAERDRLTSADRDRAREVDTLTAALEHIERVDPQPGEDEALRVEDERLAHAEGLRYAVAAAHSALVGSDDGAETANAVEMINTARATLAAETRHDPRVEELHRRVSEAGYVVADLAADLAGYLADLDADPARLAAVQARRAELAGLTRRYGDTVDEVLQWSRTAAAQLTELLGADDRLAVLETEVARLTAELSDAAAALREQRRSTATVFAAEVEAELAQLSMASARLSVTVTEREPGPYGADEVEILLAANSGAALRSVSKAASGGELSRVMLAIEVVSGRRPASRESAQAGSDLTFVFDEVDAGVGGQAALDIGARLADLAAYAQVVVVTHLPQVAAYADRHLIVRKADDGSVTASSVIEVGGQARLEELARMMGGGATSAGLEHARELLEAATRRRGSARSKDPSGLS
ncbi:MAG: DNA repair protein RecN [Actinomycetales bacterium]|nr:DNA repair protein RecN [Actinomycetales bacterium]